MEKVRCDNQFNPTSVFARHYYRPDFKQYCNKIRASVRSLQGNNTIALIMLDIAKHYLADNIKQEYSKFEKTIKLA